MRRILLGEGLENNQEEGLPHLSSRVETHIQESLAKHAEPNRGEGWAGGKVKAMTKHTEAYGKWPSKSVGLARWSVSSKLWARARRQHFQT